MALMFCCCCCAGRGCERDLDGFDIFPLFDFLDVVVDAKERWVNGGMTCACEGVRDFSVAMSICFVGCVGKNNTNVRFKIQDRYLDLHGP